MAPQLSSSVLPPLLLYILSVFSLLLVNVIRVAAFLPSESGDVVMRPLAFDFLHSGQKGVELKMFVVITQYEACTNTRLRRKMTNLCSLKFSND